MIAAARDRAGPRPRWWLVCLCLAAAVIVPALAIGLPMPFWRYADADLIFAYQGLLLNEELPQEYFDHPGVPEFIAIAAWYRGLHALSFLPLDRMDQLPPVSNPAAFEAAWQQLVMAGRLLSMAIAACFVTGFATVLRMLTRSSQVAALAGVALAFGVGITTQASMMRDELLASLFATTALFAFLFAIGTTDVRREILFGLAGLCCGFALACKVQVIFLLMGFPVTLLPFGKPTRYGGSLRLLSAGNVALVAAALLAGLQALRLVAAGIHMMAGGQAAYHLQPLHGLSGFYQAVIAAWIVLCTIVYAAVWRVTPIVTLRALGALVMGASLALILVAQTAPANLVAVTNPIETMLVWSTAVATPGVADATAYLPGTAILHDLGAGLVRTIALRTIIFHPNNIPQTVVLEWLAIAGVVAAWRTRRWRTLAQVGLLLLTAWGFEVIGCLRGFKRPYAIFTDPLVVLAAALVVAQHRVLFQGLWQRRRLRALVVGLYIVAGLVWPIVVLHRGPGPQAVCVWQANYMRRVPPFPVCNKPQSSSGAQLIL